MWCIRHSNQLTSVVRKYLNIWCKSAATSYPPNTSTTNSAMQSEVEQTLSPEKKVMEGDVSLILPPSHASPSGHVSFYNPAMRINRELVLCCLSVVKQQAHRPVYCLDAFSATGVSGLRWIKELGTVSSAPQRDQDSTTACVTSQEGENAAASVSIPTASTTTSGAATVCEPCQATAHPPTVCEPCQATAHPPTAHPLIVSFCDDSPKACRSIISNCNLNNVGVQVQDGICAQTVEAPAGSGQYASFTHTTGDDAGEPCPKQAVVETSGVSTSCQDTHDDAASGEDRNSAHLYCCDVNVLLHMRPFSFMHLDPFGSCAPYLDATFSKAGFGSVVAISSTDPMSLLGRKPNVTARHYSGFRITSTQFSRELAVRLLYTAAAQAAARQMRGIEPLFCTSHDHFSTVVVRVCRGAVRTDACVSLVQRLFLCEQCNSTSFVPTDSGVGYESLPCKCNTIPTAGRSWIELGPVWSGQIFNRQFVSDMKVHSAHLNIGSNARALLTHVVEEAVVEESAVARLKATALSLPRPCAQQAAFYYSVNNFGKKGCNAPRIVAVLDRLKEKGHLATRCFFDKIAIRTTASVSEFQETVHDLATPTNS